MQSYTHTRAYKSEEAHYTLKNKNYYLQEIHYSKEHMVDMTFRHGSKEEILKSIKQKLLTLPEETLIYPGHGEPGLISEEKPLYF